MKKGLLLLGVAAGIFSINSNAQLALENFNSGTLPTGWVLINDGHTVSSSFTGVPGLPANLTTNAWYPIHAFGGSGDYQMITTSLFTPAASADRWLITPSFMVSSPNTVIQWDDNDLNSGESLEIKVSPTAGTTAPSFTSAVYSAPAAPTSGLTTHQAQIGAYNGTNIRLAFRDTTNNNWGLVVDNVKTVILPSYDLGQNYLNLLPYVATGTSVTFQGSLRNYGYATITDMHLNYSVNGGTPVSTALTGLSIGAGTNYSYTSGTPWVPATAGAYTIKIWADALNGANPDAVHSNDTVTATISVIDTLKPKIVMVEEFTQASCDPCANAHTNVDTVYQNNLSRAVMCRYHVNFPGRDCMDSVTLSPFVSSRLSYYQVGGVPDAQVDGQYVYPGGGSFTSAVIASAASAMSPFVITITPSFNSATQTFSFNASIKSQGAVPAGLKAYAVLVEDTLFYAANQSTESIPQTIFPQVAEAMFPNASGSTLAAFTAGSTQTLSLSWTKNHAWASDRAVWSYDSTATGKILLWVENDHLTWFQNAPYVYQAASANVNTAHTAGVGTITGTNGSLNVYPNPASKEAIVALNLQSASDVKMEVYNALGQAVFTMPVEHRNAGASHTTIDVSNFAAGTYFVKVFIGGESLNSTLAVTK